jgi:hypothetical protein
LASFRQVSSLVWEIARKKSSTFIFFHRIFPFFNQPVWSTMISTIFSPTSIY